SAARRVPRRGPPPAAGATAVPPPRAAAPWRERAATPPRVRETPAQPLAPLPEQAALSSEEPADAERKSAREPVPRPAERWLPGGWRRERGRPARPAAGRRGMRAGRRRSGARRLPGRARWLSDAQGSPRGQAPAPPHPDCGVQTAPV